MPTSKELPDFEPSMASPVRSGPVATGLALTLAVGLALAGCGGDDTPAPGGSGGSGAGGKAGSSGSGSGGSGTGGAGTGGASGAGAGGNGAGGAGTGSGGASGSGPADGGAAGAGGGAGPADGSVPAGNGETFAATMLSAGAGVRTDRRPISIGFHDAKVNKTFVSWMGINSDAVVKELDHATSTWSADKIAGKATYSDKHNYPGLVRGKDDHLYLFYGAHNTPLRLARSPGPLSIAGTWTDGNIAAAAGASYPAPVVTSDGTMYVGYRWTRQSNGHTDDRPYAFVKSTDNGATWTKQMVVDPYPRPDNLTEVYNGKVSYQPTIGAAKAKIHLAWTLAGGGPGTHAHATYGRNVYYAYLDPSNDHMYDVTGRDLGTTIDGAEAEMYCKPLDTGCSNCGHQASLQVSVHYNDDGTPLIVYGHLTAGLSSLRWNGTAWVNKVVTTEKGEPREVSKFGPASFKAFRTAGNTCQVFRTTDGGESWRPETVITAPHPVGRCHVIDNHHPDAKVFMEENPGGNGGDVSVAKVSAGFDPPYQPPSQ
jgi:hypothetical protein